MDRKDLWHIIADKVFSCQTIAYYLDWWSGGPNIIMISGDDTWVNALLLAGSFICLHAAILVNIKWLSDISLPWRLGIYASWVLAGVARKIQFTAFPSIAKQYRRGLGRSWCSIIFNSFLMILISCKRFRTRIKLQGNGSFAGDDSMPVPKFLIWC